jgi:hypothetical protein
MGAFAPPFDSQRRGYMHTFDTVVMGFVTVGLAFDHRRSSPTGRQRVYAGNDHRDSTSLRDSRTHLIERFDNDAAAAATVADYYQLGMPRVVEQCFSQDHLA